MIRLDRRSLRDAAAREDVLSLLEAALDSVSPSRLLREAVARDGDVLTVVGRRYPMAGRRVFLLGAGKAAGGMAEEVERLLADALTAGVVVVPYGSSVSTKRVRVYEGGHPLPDEGGLAGARALETLAEDVRAGDLVVCLFSGGASALLSLPAAGIDLADLSRLTRGLLLSGASIDEVNTVRRHVTRLLGGGLARILAPAETITLLLSDVPGDRPESIASGPTVPDPTTFREARDVLLSHGLWRSAPPAVRQRLDAGAVGRVPETAKPGDEAFARASVHIVGTNRTAIDAVVREGTRRGYAARALGEPITGEACLVGRDLAQGALDLATAEKGPWLLVGGGETTVVVRGGGRGGRNQEVALSAALELEGGPDVFVASLATDGKDGPTDAAGAIIDGQTASRARRRGFDPVQALDQNDSYPVLEATGDLLFSGPTGTNVADLFLVLSRPGTGREGASA